VKNGMPQENSPVAAMLMTHDQGRNLVRAMEEAALKAQAGEAGQIPVIAENARGYAALLRDHIDKEDNILYPLAERVLPAEVRPEMIQAYRDAEARDPDIESRYRRMVEEYEKQSAA
jgi:hemerythrin-like domain-containing protein